MMLRRAISTMRVFMMDRMASRIVDSRHIFACRFQPQNKRTDVIIRLPGDARRVDRLDFAHWPADGACAQPDL